MSKSQKTPMERAATLANRIIPKNAPRRHALISFFTHGYEAGWNARAKWQQRQQQRDDADSFIERQ